MTDLNRIVCPYHFEDRKEEVLRKTLEEVGFENVQIELMEKEFSYYDPEVLKRELYFFSMQNILVCLFIF